MLASSLLLMSALSSPGRSEDSLMLLTEENPPFNFLDSQSGQISGPSVDLVKEIMKQAGISFRIRMMPWRRAFMKAQEEKNTCLFSMNYTPERAPLFKWVRPLYQGGWAFYQRADSDVVIAGEQDIKGRVIVGETAAAVSNLNALPGVSVLEVGDELAAYELLMRGRGDLWLVGLLGASNVLNDASRAATVKMAYNWRPSEVALGCSLATDDALMRKMNDANTAIGDQRAEIFSRYF
jgi:polar amino acid transport system substrate-binding protein